MMQEFQPCKACCAECKIVRLAGRFCRTSPESRYSRSIPCTAITAVSELAPDDSTQSHHRPHQKAVLQNEAVAHAWDMQEGTFGHAYARFMGDRKFLAGDRPPVRFVDDVELAYVAARAREVHDFWHVLFGCHTNVFGELALKAVELVQV